MLALCPGDCIHNWIVNYKLCVMPAEIEQYVYLAFSTSDKIAKKWGVNVAK